VHCEKVANIMLFSSRFSKISHILFWISSWTEEVILAHAYCYFVHVELALYKVGLSVRWDILTGFMVDYCILYMWRKGECFFTVHPIHYPDDESSKILWNIGQYLPGYTVQHARRQPSFYTLISSQYLTLKH
jgi:hypothetical protein